MKAIDFACRLLLSLSQEPHSDIMQRILLGLAAGLETSEDISKCLGINSGACTTGLRRLKAEKLVTDVCGDWSYYRLTEQGKAVIIKIFSFLPPSPLNKHEKETSPQYR